MPRLAHLYFRTAIIFLFIGIAMGLHMSMSGNHNVTGAHAHANLLGWVTMAIFGGYFALNPAKAETRLAWVQYGVYTLGVALMVPSLYLLLRGNPGAGPVVGASSFITAAGVILFAVILFTGDAKQSLRTLART